MSTGVTAGGPEQPDEPPHLRPLGIGELLDVAIKVCARNVGTLARIVLVVIVPIQLLSIVVTALTLPDGMNPGTFGGGGGGFDFDEPQAQPDFDGGELAAWIGGQVVVGLLGFVATTFATGAAFKALADAYLGARADWRDSLRFALARLHSLVWLSIITAVFLVFAFIALIVPGVWLGIAWVVAVPALMFEDKRNTGALRRSFNLVKGRWWPVAGAVVIGYVLAFIVAAVVSGLVLAGTAAIDDPLVSVVGQGIGNGIASLVTLPFQAAIVALVYFDLRVRKEGFDLQLLAERLGTTPDAGASPLAGRSAAGVPVPPPAAPAAYGQYPPHGQYPPPQYPPPGQYPPPPGPAQYPPQPGQAQYPPPQGAEQPPPYWPPPPGWQSPPGGQTEEQEQQQPQQQPQGPSQPSPPAE